MTEWNQPPEVSASTLEDVLEKIRKLLKRFKGGQVFILVAGVVVFVFWTAWFTVQPEETGIVQRFGKVVRTAGPDCILNCRSVSKMSVCCPRPACSKRSSAFGHWPPFLAKRPAMIRAAPTRTSR